jgi:hypothetical protein
MMWPGGLLALGLTLGCRHTQPQSDGCTTCNNPPPAIQPATVSPAPTKLSLVPTTPPLVPAPQSVLTDDLPPVTVPSRMPLAAAPQTPPPAPTRAAAPPAIPLIPSTPVATRPAPVTVNPEQSAPPAQPAPVPVIVQKPVLTERGATPAPAVAPKPVLTERGTSPAPSKWVMPQAQVIDHVPTPVITTPAPAATTSTSTAPPYYNSPDYSILFGVLDFNRRTGVWRLRYADAGDEDRYGGCVTLDGVGRQMQEFASGQTVRIEGALVDTESRDVSPAYRVKEMRPVTSGK